MKNMLYMLFVIAAVDGAVTLVGEDGAIGPMGPPGPAGSGMPACAHNQVAKRIAGQWVCGEDDRNPNQGNVTALTAGDGLVGGGTIGTVALSLRSGCLAGDVLASDGAGGYDCAPDRTAFTPSPTGAFASAVATTMMSVESLAVQATGAGAALAVSTAATGARGARIEATSSTQQLPLVIEDSGNAAPRLAMRSNVADERWVFEAEMTTSPRELRVMHRNSGGTETSVVRARADGVVHLRQLQIGAQPFSGGENGAFVIGMRANGTLTCVTVCQAHGFTNCHGFPLRIPDGSNPTPAALNCPDAPATNANVLCPCYY